MPGRAQPADEPVASLVAASYAFGCARRVKRDTVTNERQRERKKERKTESLKVGALTPHVESCKACNSACVSAFTILVACLCISLSLTLSSLTRWSKQSTRLTRC